MTRRYLTKVEKSALWNYQNQRCAGCGEPTAKPEYDHVNPLWSGGGHEGNFQALCGPCHTAKTGSESTARGHTKRLEKQRLGVEKKRPGRKLPARPFGPSRGFDTSLRRRMNGRVEVRT